MEETTLEVKIGNRTYPLSATKGEEEKVLQTAALVNDYIKRLKGDFVVTDMTDLLAMAAFEFASKVADSSETPKYVPSDDGSGGDQVGERLDELNSFVSTYLESL